MKPTTKTVKKINIVKKPVVLPLDPSFRLFHFDILNMTREELEGADDCSVGTNDSDESNKKYKKKRVDDKLFICQMYGINEKGETACIFVNDFEPFFYVKVEDNWSASHMNDFVRELKKCLGDYYKDSLVKWTLIDSQKLYGFAAGKQSKFVKLVFTNTVAFNKAKNLWFTKNIHGIRSLCYYKTKQGKRMYTKECLPVLVGTELYEANLPPLLRYFHINSVWPNGWVSVDKVPSEPTTITSCKY